MKERNMTVSTTWANIFGIIFTVIVFIAFTIPWIILWRGHEKSLGMPRTYLFLLIIVFIVVHELIHGITWSFFAERGWKNISFGFNWKGLMPYCHCDVPLNVRQYIIGALMPLIILGIIPLIFSYILPYSSLHLLAFFNVISACGDILIVWKLRKEPLTNLVYDHPTEPGCIIYENDDE